MLLQDTQMLLIHRNVASNFDYVKNISFIYFWKFYVFLITDYF